MGQPRGDWLDHLLAEIQPSFATGLKKQNRTDRTQKETKRTQKKITLKKTTLCPRLEVETNQMEAAAAAAAVPPLVTFDSATITFGCRCQEELHSEALSGSAHHFYRFVVFRLDD
jgi:hypothetical protein